MSKTVPVVIATLVGLLMIVAYFSPRLLEWRDVAQEWYTIVAAIAIFLGGTNLCLHHLKKVSDRNAGWGFSAVTLLSFAITLVVGLLKWGVAPDSLRNLDHPWSGPILQEGGAFWWIFQYISTPILSTMFALLAFYVASAAFRAFRAKNFEAILLLLTALIVLVGQTKDREFTSLFLSPPNAGVDHYLPVADLTEFVRKTFVTAGQRAIMIGIALGVVATSLRILLGLDRSYLGGDD